MIHPSADTPLRHPPLPQQVQEILARRIQEGTYPSNTQLPAESELAAEFNVSRATVRSALSNLAMLGLVVRRHGAGTFVTPLPHITNPLDQAIDFQELIARFNCCPAVHYVHTIVEPSNPTVAKALQIPAGSAVLVTHKIFTADGAPMIFCINTLPEWVFPDGRIEEALGNPAMIEPIFPFMETGCGQRIEYSYARLRPERAKSCVFHTSLPFSPNTPILVIEEIAYSQEGRPLFYTFEYHPNDKMSFEIVRRWT